MEGAPAAADSTRGARRFLALALFVAAAGAVIGALFWIQPSVPPVLLSIPIGEYEDRSLPPNPWAEEDSDTLREALPAAAGSEKGYNYQERTRLREVLQGLRNLTPVPPVVVVHLTALATVHEGGLYVLPGRAKPGVPGTWLPIDEVLDALTACPSKHKLLLLDLAHPTADLFHGPLADTVAERLHEHLLAKVKRNELPFFVLTACSSNELSLPMAEEQQSAFMFYVVDGLRGAAEGFGPNGQLDGRVRVTELADYVRTRVNRWARDCRGMRQTPRLYGEQADFDLTDRKQMPPEAKEGRAYPDWLLAGWKKRDEWVSKRAYRPAPIAVNSLQAALPQAERDWQAVGRPDRVQRVEDNVRSTLEMTATAYAQTRDDPPPTLRSVTVGSPPNAPAEWSTLLESFLTAAADPKEAAKAKEFRTKFLEKSNATPEARKTAATLIWRRLLEDAAPKEETVRGLSELWDEVDPGTTEAQAARRLATWRRPGGTPWPSSAARQLFHAEDAASRAVAAAPAAFPAAKTLFDTATGRRRKGEEMLFDPVTRSREEQKAAAEVLQQAEQEFVAAARQMGVVQSARAAVEDAALILPALAGRIADDGNRGNLRNWLDAADAATKLNGWLEAPASGGEFPLGEWESSTGRLKIALQALGAPYRSDVIKRRVEELAPGRAPEYQALLDLLRGPMLVGADRKRVWDTARSIAGRIHKQTRDADAADNDALRPPGANRSPDPPLQDEKERRERRSQLSIALLGVAGLDNIEALASARRAALGDATKWEPLASSIRAAWAIRLAEQAGARRVKQEWPAADRRERFLPLERAPAGRPAAVEVRRADVSAYLQWLEWYYGELGAMRKGEPRAAAFYDEAAKEIHAARISRGD
jgi:hypothetical protein